MSSRHHIDLRQILLEGARDRLRSLKATDRQEALLAIHSLYKSAATAELSDLLPMLTKLEEALIEGVPGAVERAHQSIKRSLERLQRSDDEPPEDVLECFEDEADDHLAHITAGLDELERDPGAREAQEDVYRSLHTFKGAAAMVGQTEAAGAAHKLEDLLQDVLDQRRMLDEKHLGRLRSGVEQLQQLLRRCTSGDDEEIELAPPAESRGDTERAEIDVPELMGKSPRQAQLARPETGRFQRKRRADTTTVLRVPLAQTGTLLDTARTVRSASGRLRSATTGTNEIARELSALHRALMVHADRDEALVELGRRLRQSTGALTSITDDLERQTAAIDRTSRSTSALVQQLRATSASWLFKRLEVVAEDVARKLGRRLIIEREGDTVEVDRQVAGYMLDPLLHLVRNAVAHGIEAPAQRVALGKEPSGRLKVTAKARVGWLTFTVEDNGAGIDLSLLRCRLRDKGIKSAREIALARDAQILQWIFLPGVSTKAEADVLSGRGVGLDAVRSDVARRGGSVEVETWPGKGSRFVVTVPHPMETQKALVVTAGGTKIAIPLSVVRKVELARVESEGEAKTSEQVVDLCATLGLEPRHLAWRHVVNAEIGDRRLSLIVDEIDAFVEITLAPNVGRVTTIGPYLGVGIDQAGDAILVLDVADLLPARAKTTPPRPLRVLLAEDSASTRTLLVGILETAGYEVISAADGLEAWSHLCSEPFDLLVTDIEMPRLDGLELVGRLRAEQELADLPAVVLTSNEADEIKARATSMRVAAFVLKQEGEEALLDAVRVALRDDDAKAAAEAADEAF